ncbi:hypothetical protein JK191_10880 [Gluconobacter sphaericus]|uniref:hypothetical protein n=1 Tax=Gluconobacter sphaericus TaxID=574987 RepID=UPI001B8B63BC|nr:hypothetical protein [Gluconobacter sphaericus]MBS1098061.1 hypothetical protein [Gluconobacter sphaericus]
MHLLAQLHGPVSDRNLLTADDHAADLIRNSGYDHKVLAAQLKNPRLKPRENPSISTVRSNLRDTTSWRGKGQGAKHRELLQKALTAAFGFPDPRCKIVDISAHEPLSKTHVPFRQVLPALNQESTLPKNSHKKKAPDHTGRGLFRTPKGPGHFSD